jgi:heat-inducible transcriptional repressor
MTGLSLRRDNILRIITEDYVAAATPIASKSIVYQHNLGISPAAVRREMAYLEAEGYIARPHHSAGAVPLDKGYRYYVEQFIGDAGLSAEEEESIQNLFYQVTLRLEDWLKLVTEALARRIGNLALVTFPQTESHHFKHLDLVALEEFLILLILVLQRTELRRQLLASEQKVSQDELNLIANRLNEAYQNLTWSQIDQQQLELSPLEKLVSTAVIEIMQTEEQEQRVAFYLDGLRHLLNQPEFDRSSNAIELVELIEERHLLSRLVNSLGDAPIKIVIGHENEESALQECSVILRHYQLGEAKGAIGVIGPTRMPYKKVIPTVNYFSRAIGQKVAELVL